MWRNVRVMGNDIAQVFGGQRTALPNEEGRIVVFY
jgi:hypothetical protein